MPEHNDLLKIAGGRVVDPSNSVDTVGDIWIAGGRVVAAPSDPALRPARTIDARGCVVMPGAVDAHSHIAGSKVNSARLLRPEEARDADPIVRFERLRSGAGGSVPTTFATGYKYAGLGYTFAVDAAIPPLGARHAHHELADTPAIDKAILVLLGNNHFVMDRIAEGARARLRDYVAWVLHATRGYGVKIVNPGGVEQWKQARGALTALDDEVSGFGVTPRAILVELARAVDDLRLPHPIHVHGLQLGMPGSADATSALIEALDGHRAHLAHVQFLSYAGDPSDATSLRSGVARLADQFNNSPRMTCDVGQVLFGETTSMTADGAVGEFLHHVTHRKWLSQDVELETGCGVVPIEYSDKNFVHALQWCIGLEWFLLVNDPWRLALSTDHPNGATFSSYPRIIALLMSKTLRDEVFQALPKKARDRSCLGDLSREYTLSEIAIVTRAAPARMLGLTDRGHLGAGAVGDVAIYGEDIDKERMFSLPRWVIKDGRVILDSGVLRDLPAGRVYRAAPPFDPAVVDDVRAWFNRDASVSFDNMPISDPLSEEVVA